MDTIQSLVKGFTQGTVLVSHQDQFEGDQKDAGFQQHVVVKPFSKSATAHRTKVRAMIITDQRSKCLKRELPTYLVYLGH